MGLLFIVSTQASISAPTPENLFDEPAFGQGLKTRRCLGITLDDFTLDDFQFDAALVLNLAPKVLSFKALVAKDDLQVLSPRLTFDLNESG